MVINLRSRGIYPLLSFLVLLAVAFTLGSQMGWAQASGFATLSGTVTDQSGSVIPGVTVTATNTNTGVTSRSQSNTRGLYYIGALPPGPYKITAQKAGFKQWARTVQLEVSQNADVDFQMQVGSPTTVVEVTGAPPLLNTTGTAVGDVLDHQRINQLPLNGRSVTTLFNLTPGVEGGGSARVNGMKVGSMGIQLDGITEVDRYGGGIVPEQPDIGVVQEFSIDTSGSDAKYGTPSTVIMKTRSGTNQLHGELFETHRNNTGGLLALARGQTSTNQFPKDIRNEFGGSIGGPVVIPHVYNGHDKTFFFFNYEGHREVGRSGNLTETSYGNVVPTLAMWNGDLSNKIDASTGTQYTIYDPLTTNSSGQRQAFANDVIPPSRISTFAKTLESMTQLPSNNNNPYLAENMIAYYPEFTSENKITAKVDENFSAKDRLSVRWTRDPLVDNVAGGVYGNPRSPSDALGTGSTKSTVTNVDVNYTRTISSSMLNELVLGALREPFDYGTQYDNVNWSAKLGLPTGFAPGWPSIGSPFYWWDALNHRLRALTTYVAQDNFTWVKGKHTIQLGGHFDKQQNNINYLQNAQGEAYFNDQWTCQFDATATACLPYTGSSFAGILLGLPASLSEHYNHGYYYFRENHVDLYFNDKWRVTPRLTLSLGMRWDKWTPYSEKYNRIDSAPLDSILNSWQVITPGNAAITSLPDVPPGLLQSYANAGMKFSTAAAYGYPSNLFSEDNNNFGPRLGGAFKINNKTVIRGAYGIFYWPMPLAEILTTSRNNTPLDNWYGNNMYGPGVYGLAPDPNNINFNYRMTSVPSSDNFIPNASVLMSGPVPIYPYGNGMTPYDGRNWYNDKMQNWNVTLERQLPYRMTLRLTYTGNHGSDLEQRVAINDRIPQITYAETTGQAPPSNKSLLSPNPAWGIGNGYIAHNGISNSNSIQAQVEHKYHNGTVFQWYYVYDHGLTTTDAGSYSAADTGINSGGGGGRIPENSDILGQPNLSFNQLQHLVYFNMTTIPVQHYGWNGLVDLPFGHGKKFLGGASGALNQLVGGWQIAFIGDWLSGYWRSVNTGLVQSGDPRLSSSQRITMNYNGDQQQMWFAGLINPANASNVQGGMSALTNLVGPNGDKVLQRFGPDCSGSYSGAIAVTLANGNCFNAPSSDFYNGYPRGNIIGPSRFSMDGSVFKNFTIHERVKLRFTADFFNVLNHPTNNYPNSTTGLVDLSTQANNPRLIQFSLHLMF